ncbi:hypothetical protein, partial [Phytoactinopolyspora endophytica]|uniref:hypothetical protein n=1 Tax=Phytoactinopolyspora endophytica TaxID=1642495 RepID=UPI0013EB4C94
MLSTVTVAQATALEFRVPSSRGARSDGSYAHNVIIRLRATRAGDSLEGVGEAAPRTRIVTGDTPRGSWRFLDAALRELRGTTITPGVATARAEIGKLMADLGLLAERTLRTTVPGAPYRGTLAGVECALLDLVGRSGSAPLAEVLGGARRPVPVAQVISAARGASHVEQRAARDSGQAVIKLTDISDHREALDVALAAASAAGRLAPIWLELTSDLPLSDAITLVESLSSRVDRGELPAHLVLQPASTGDLTGLVRLQAAADRLVPTTPEGPGVVVMASPASIDDAHAAVDGGLRGIVLDPARLGGYLCALDVGQWLEQRDGDVRVAVSTVPHV